MVARSASGRRLNRSKLAKIWPSGLWAAHGGPVAWAQGKAGCSAPQASGRGGGLRLGGGRGPGRGMGAGGTDRAGAPAGVQGRRGAGGFSGLQPEAGSGQGSRRDAGR